MDNVGVADHSQAALQLPGQWYQVGANCQLHLMVYEEDIPYTMRHIALEAANFEEAVQELRANGVDIVDGQGKRRDGSDYLCCKDPDGNRVDITQHFVFLKPEMSYIASSS